MRANVNSPLNKRQWALYRYLKKQSVNGIKSSRRQIQKDLVDYYPISSPNLANDLYARLITDDIQIINNCAMIQKLIISDPGGIKIATKEEALQHLKLEEKALKRKLLRTSIKFKKCYRDGQGRLALSKYARPFVEAYITEGKSA